MTPKSFCLLIFFDLKPLALGCNGFTKAKFDYFCRVCVMIRPSVDVGVAQKFKHFVFSRGQIQQKRHEEGHLSSSSDKKIVIKTGQKSLL